MRLKREREPRNLEDTVEELRFNSKLLSISVSVLSAFIIILFKRYGELSERLVGICELLLQVVDWIKLLH